MTGPLGAWSCVSVLPVFYISNNSGGFLTLVLYQ